MKKIILINLSLLFVLSIAAQEKFGQLTFNVPQGWQISTGEQVVLQKPLQKGVVCKIIISSATKGPVTTEAGYIKYRNANNSSNVSYSTARGSVTKYEANGLTSFFSSGTTTQGMTTVRSYFYSLTNGVQTVFYQLLTNNNQCISEFNTFQSSLTMETEDAEASKAKRKKVAPGAPAAPAPMM